jgi:hypothetical protein
MVVMLAPVKVEEELLSLPEAAAELGVSHVQFWRLMRADKVPVVQVGTTPGQRMVYGVRRDALEALKAARIAEPPRPGPKPGTRKPAP